MLISSTSCRARIAMPCPFTDATPSDIFDLFHIRQFCGAPPERIRGSAKKNDSETNRGTNWLRCDSVTNESHRGENEDNRCPWISRHAIRPRSFRSALAVDKNAGRKRAPEAARPYRVP